MRIGLSCQYELRPEATLAGYFALKVMHKPRVVRQRRHVGQLQLYEQVLAGFLADPSDPENLPHGLAHRLVRVVA